MRNEVVDTEASSGSALWSTERDKWFQQACKPFLAFCEPNFQPFCPQIFTHRVSFNPTRTFPSFNLTDTSFQTIFTIEIASSRRYFAACFGFSQLCFYKVSFTLWLKEWSHLCTLLFSKTSCCLLEFFPLSFRSHYCSAHVQKGGPSKNEAQVLGWLASPTCSEFLSLNRERLKEWHLHPFCSLLDIYVHGLFPLILWMSLVQGIS